MSSTSYRLESFRPWNLPQEKVHPLRDLLDICRYPSPVSISPTPSPSNLNDPVSGSHEAYAPRPEQHPLPARPPAEVCFNGSPQSNTQLEPEVLERTSPINPGPRTFDFDDSLYLDDLPSSGDVGCTMTFEQTAPGSEHQFLDFDSSGGELTFTPDQRSQLGFLESSIETGPSSEGPTIDPAILDDSPPCGVEQDQTTGTTPAVAALPRRVPANHSPPGVRDAHYNGRQQTPQRLVKAGRLPAKISKVSVVIDNRRKSRTGRSTPELGYKDTSLPTIRAQFSVLPVEERLEFLSWLFEGALSHCLHASPRRDKVRTSTSQHASTSVKVVDAGSTLSRKGLSWSAEEDRLLVKLREEDKLGWSEVTKQFGQKFTGRSQGSIQVHWSTTLKKQGLSLVKDS